MRHLLGLGAAGDRLDGTGAAEIMADGAPLERTELDTAHVAEIVTERVHRVAGTGSIAEDVRVAVQLRAQLFEVAAQSP